MRSGPVGAGARTAVAAVVIALLATSCESSGPFFVETLIVGDTSDPLGPYTVMTTVTDDVGVAQVRITYHYGSISSAAITRDLRRGAGEEVWQREIPGPGHAARIYYFLEAWDDDGNLARDPALGPDMYSFDVTPEVRPPILLDAGPEDRVRPDWSEPDRAIQEDGGAPDASGFDSSGNDLGLHDVSAPDVAASDLGASDLPAGRDRARSDLFISIPDLAFHDLETIDNYVFDRRRRDLGADDVDGVDHAAPDVARSDLEALDLGAPDMDLLDHFPCGAGFIEDESGHCAGWFLVGEITLDPFGHAAARLDDGRVVISGGAGDGYMLVDDLGCTPIASSIAGTDETELFDPGSDSWSAGPPLLGARTDHSATVLHDGRLLIAGGLRYTSFLQDSMLSTPAMDGFSATTVMAFGRRDHTATLLDDGRVLATGGRGNLCSGGTAAELFVPATGVWESAGQMLYGRQRHTATLLDDGRVLVVAGENNGDMAMSDTRLYDPLSGGWVTADALDTARFDHSATLLDDGRVLVAGGTDQHGAVFGSVEIYDPIDDLWRAGPDLRAARGGHVAVKLDDGRVLVAGGVADGGLTLDHAEVFDPLQDRWDLTARMRRARDGHTGTLLHDGRALVVGGSGQTTEVYVVAP